MGCGQSKINIYPRKSKGKNNSKKNVTGDKPEGEEDEGTENEQDVSERSDDGSGDDGKKKPTRTKHVVGGPLVAQTELSSSQQNFFKMLDEKIENGPDYDSNDETEIALETARLHSLLKDWETASASSRSLPSTPRHIPRGQSDRASHSAPKSHSRIPSNVIHQGYGVTPPIVYRQPNYNPAYQSHSPPQQQHYIQNIPNVPQYHQEYTQNYTIPRYYQTPIPNPVPPISNPVYHQSNSPKHSKYSQNSQNVNYTIQNSPSHKMYANPPNQSYTNGELIIQQQLYNQQIQYQQSREYQQYRQSREQLLVQQQICGPNSGYATVGTPHQRGSGTHYQSSVHVPIVAVLPQNEQSPNLSIQRKQRQYSQDMT